MRLINENTGNISSIEFVNYADMHAMKWLIIQSLLTGIIVFAFTLRRVTSDDCVDKERTSVNCWCRRLAVKLLPD